MHAILAESYLHRLDPLAIRFPAAWSDLPLVPEGIRWYAMAYIAGFVIAWLIIAWMARTGRSLLRPWAVGDLMTYFMVGVLVGGRLGYVLIYDQRLLWEFSSAAPFWGVLAINQGGMASHGGMIGVILGCWLFGRRHAVDPWHLFDLAVFAGPPGLLLGRIGNFINGELWGQPLPVQENPPWWSVKYPEQLLLPSFDPARLATERHELLDVLRLPSDAGDGQLFHVAHAAMIDGNQAVIELVQPALTAYYPSQLIQAFAEGVVVWAVLALIWRRSRKPGVVTGWFFIVYGVLRIVTELFRQPDEGVARWLGLSRGQSLSVLMILAGAAMLTWFVRRPAAAVGGLIRR